MLRKELQMCGRGVEVISRLEDSAVVFHKSEENEKVYWEGKVESRQNQREQRGKHEGNNTMEIQGTWCTGSTIHRERKGGRGRRSSLRAASLVHKHTNKQR